MSCDFLNESGVPTLCFLHIVELSVVAIAFPFTIYDIWRRRRPSKEPVHLSVSAATCRRCALCSSALFAVLSAFHLSLAELPLTLLAVLISALHYAETYIHPETVASAELLLWWMAATVITGSKFAARPSSYRYAFLSMAAGMTWLWETYSSPAHPRGYEEASVFGKINMSFLNDMIKKAQERIITAEDFAGRPETVGMEYAHAKFQEKFDQYPVGSKYRVMRTLTTFYKSRLIFLFLLGMVVDLVWYSQPLLLSWFLKSLQMARETSSIRHESLYFALAIGLTHLIANAVSGLRQNISNAMYLDTRTALMEAIYRKALNISSDVRQEYDTAKIMNLLNVDTTMVQVAYFQFNILFSAPIGLILCTIQLYAFLGKATLAAVPVYLLYLPYSSWATKKQLRRFPESMAAKDERAKSTLSIMRNIKSLKLYAWEKPYEQKVYEDRRKELGISRKFLKLRVAFREVTGQLDYIVLTAVFLGFLYLSDKPLSPEIVFPALAMIALVSDPLFSLPSAISELGGAFTSQKRILQFLEQPEETFDNYYRQAAVAAADFKTPVVELIESEITWERSETSPVAVKPLSLELRRGDLCCVLGKVGSGKSALLKALCSQLFVKSGSITIKGSIAYASQEPWLQYRSLRDNILFGLEYDAKLYASTLAACDLDSDIASFPEGDLTEIGEKGISLSGGQKARVALARAVYSCADVYILDDVLSAVDQHVSNKLLRKLIASDGLLRSKVIILATHTAKSLKLASHLVCLSRGGDIVFNGSPADARASDLVSATTESLDSKTIADLLPPKSYDRRGEAEEKASEDPISQRYKTVDPGNPNITFIPGNFTKNEMLPEVPILGVYKRYLRSASSVVAVCTLTLLVTDIVSASLTNLWLTLWSDKGLSGIHDSMEYIEGFLFFVVLNAILSSASYYTFFGPMALRAAQTVHDQMLDNVVHTPMSFFERTPLGAIMSHFTGDISSLDESLPRTMYFFLNMLLNSIANLSIALFGSPLTIVVLVPMFFKYNDYRKAFVPASRQLQKLISASQGPLLSHIEESVRGVVTLSAFDAKDQFVKGIEQRGNYWAHASFLRFSLRRWLNTRIALMTANIMTVSMLSIVLLVRYMNLPVSVAGIVLYGLRVAGARLSRIIELWTQIEVSVVGVERIFDYIDIPREAPYYLDTPAKKLEVDWPSKGEIRFENYSTKYRPDLDDVLHKITISISRKEKIGVVGRTGAGKSTLTMALFRILEASAGKIDIDDVDTSELGLFDLRHRLSIIPQEAQIFKGTLRQNLDPFYNSTDAELWRVLELCHLKDHFESGLDTEISEGGENISRGQAQLICLGRALLRRTKILVLDEATASVDSNTDSLVQSTIRREFGDRTIITIAHRLDTVMDSDKILVLDKGSVLEFDSPRKLLEHKGAFYHLLHAKH